MDYRDTVMNHLGFNISGMICFVLFKKKKKRVQRCRPRRFDGQKWKLRQQLKVGRRRWNMWFWVNKYPHIRTILHGQDTAFHLTSRYDSPHRNISSGVFHPADVTGKFSQNSHMLLWKKRKKKTCCQSEVRCSLPIWAQQLNDEITSWIVRGKKEKKKASWCWS